LIDGQPLGVDVRRVGTDRRTPRMDAESVVARAQGGRVLIDVWGRVLAVAELEAAVAVLLERLPILELMGNRRLRRNSPSQ
jgi:uncharacterized small protein (DUF1192 family)